LSNNVTNSNRINWNKIRVIAFFVFGIVIIPNVFYHATKKDEVIVPVMENLSSSSEYTLYQDFKPEPIGDGSLGEFYQCLKNYRDISARKTNGEGLLSFIFKFNDGVSLHIISTFTETIQFSAKIDNGEQVEMSKGYAVNCPLNLANIRVE
jgi:hypothetical protein